MFWPTSLIQETSQDPARLEPSWGSILGPLLFLGSWAVAASLNQCCYDVLLTVAAKLKIVVTYCSAGKVAKPVHPLSDKAFEQHGIIYQRCLWTNGKAASWIRGLLGEDSGSFDF